jgi:LuxR family transcriptional regulator, maltose regulon positive regulatory protein
MPRREHKATPKVVSGWLYHEDGAVKLDTAEWQAWLQDARSFYFESVDGSSFTATKERRKDHDEYWYANRRAHKHLYRAYLGKSENLTMARLVDVARQLDDKVRSE